jgi:predicted O-linked N-acetylglucosamine transferase (SPINDLY family)
MDYRIVDTHTDPVGATEHLHTEQLVRMPHSQWCYYAWHDVDWIQSPHRDRPEVVKFGSFNQYAKITEATLALWSQLLSLLDDWELTVFDVRHSATGELLLRRMAQNGIDTRRVRLRGREPIADYLRAISSVDIALDTIPYNGATTTLDVLWMGVPIVGLRGDRGVSRSTYSILRTLGLDELIADSKASFVDMNLKLAHQASLRAHLRRNLRNLMLASPLMDAQGFTRALERIYREIWQRWCLCN